MKHNYDIVIVGAGHAGCEAAVAASKLGSSVLLVSMNLDTLAQMSCNPAMGGIGKGQLIREIDALGGFSGIVTDRSAVQVRMLNKSKGPAVWSPRAQSDRMLFKQEWRKMIESIPNVYLRQDLCTEIIVKKGSAIGIKTQWGAEIYAKAVVLTAGTFLNGKLFIGSKVIGGGRISEKSSTGISDQLQSLGLQIGRLKTGTSPRIDGRSIDFSKMEEQKGDNEAIKFSFHDTPLQKKQLSCYITYTNEDVHDFIQKQLQYSPLKTGAIVGAGPRYCPSIEDKVVRFQDKNRHQLFIEPEGWNTVEMYINGFSTSMSEEAQLEALHSIAGLEKCIIFKPGYAVEYDYFPPTQLKHSLESKCIPNLFCAGQINGTTGYEEAAAQGFMAGLNAAMKIKGLPEVVFNRSDAYIGVLIDDLVRKGTDEPYRMFTSRAEYRLSLRQDNADIRLTPLAYSLGIVSDKQYEKVMQKQNNVSSIIAFLKNCFVQPSEVNEMLNQKQSTPIIEKQKVANLLLRPQISIDDIQETNTISPYLQNYSAEEIAQAEINIKYESYLNKEADRAQQLKRMENIKINPNIDYSKINSISNEAKEKLGKIRPESLGQASRISGITTSDIMILAMNLRSNKTLI
ncbi:MAG: tRNA uridine-5-carboxymethylaminomethyl(34) synthesis enzyme MnmG [Solitalea-like symbiont of Tyrophagus putrescentiae]